MNQADEYEKLSFEEAMKELEAVVAKLDAGEGTLDESIDLLQKGMKLSKLCGRRLDEIEKRIKILTDAGTETDFAETADSHTGEG